MELSHLIIVLILLGCMATYIPVFMCLFFTAVLGFVFFTDLPLLLLAQSLYALIILQLLQTLLLLEQRVYGQAHHHQQHLITRHMWLL